MLNLIVRKPRITMEDNASTGCLTQTRCLGQAAVNFSKNKIGQAASPGTSNVIDPPVQRPGVYFHTVQSIYTSSYGQRSTCIDVRHAWCIACAIQRHFSRSIRSGFICQGKHSTFLSRNSLLRDYRKFEVPNWQPADINSLSGSS